MSEGKAKNLAKYVFDKTKDKRVPDMGMQILQSLLWWQKEKNKKVK